jgi:hypothetical protein
LKDSGSAYISVSIAGCLFLDADMASTSLAGSFCLDALEAVAPTAQFKYKDMWFVSGFTGASNTCCIPFKGSCPIHLVTVKVKVNSSLLIKIIVSIKVILVLVEGFSLLQNLNIKLPSTFVLSRKEVKRVLYFVPGLTEF